MINILLSLKDYNRPLVYFFAAIEFSICFVSNIFTDSVRKVNSKSEKQDRILLRRNRQTKKRERTLSVDAPRVSHKYNCRFVFLCFYVNLCTVPYSASFRSPSLTQPALRRKRLISGQMTAGRMTATKANPIQSTVVIPVLKPDVMSLTQPV